MIAVALALLPLLVALPLAPATPVPGESAIPPVVWELVSFTPTGGEQTAIADPSRYTIQFLPDGAVAAQFDCNHGGGAFTIDGDTIEFGPMRTTLIGCESDSQAQPFQLLLEAATAFAYDEDGQLTLTGDKGSLTFRAALSGVAWEWKEFLGGDDTIVQPGHPEHYSVTFLPDGALAIQADCNRATGVYTVDGAQIALEVRGVTRAMCSPGSLEQPYLRDLSDVTSLVLRQGRLYLALPADAGILTFAPQPLASPTATPEAG